MEKIRKLSAIFGSTNSSSKTNSGPTEKYKKRLIERQQRNVNLQPKGIPNTGNTCYMNALIQVLCWTPGIESKLVVQLLGMIETTYKIPGGITGALFDLVDNNLSTEPLDVGILKRFLSIIKKHNRQFTGNKQQDCFELFNTIIEAVEDEVKRDLSSIHEDVIETPQGEPKAQSLVTCLFEGTFKTEYRYGSCTHEDDKYQRFTSISVPPVPTVQKDNGSQVQEKPTPNDHEMDINPLSSVNTDIDAQKSKCPSSNESNEKGETNLYIKREPSVEYKQDDHCETEKVKTDAQMKEQSIPKDLDMRVNRQSYYNTISEEENSGNDSILQKYSTEYNREGSDAQTGVKSAPKKAETVSSLAEGPASKSEKLQTTQKDTSHIAGINERSKTKNDECAQMEKKCAYNNLVTKVYEDCIYKDIQHSTTAKHDVGTETPQSISTARTELELGLYLLAEVFDETVIECRKCITVGNKTTQKKLVIKFPPPILVLHLNRFEQVNGAIQKINKTITYPNCLDLTFLCSETTKYNLYGVVLHKGTIRKGHYTAYIKTSQTSTNTQKQESEVCKGGVTEESCNWYHVDDSKVHHVKKTDVVNSPDAYMLFYYKTK